MNSETLRTAIAMYVATQKYGCTQDELVEQFSSTTYTKDDITWACTILVKDTHLTNMEFKFGYDTRVWKYVINPHSRYARKHGEVTKPVRIVPSYDGCWVLDFPGEGSLAATSLDWGKLGVATTFAALASTSAQRGRATVLKDFTHEHVPLYLHGSFTITPSGVLVDRMHLVYRYGTNQDITDADFYTAALQKIIDAVSQLGVSFTSEIGVYNPDDPKILYTMLTKKIAAQEKQVVALDKVRSRRQEDVITATVAYETEKSKLDQLLEQLALLRAQVKELAMYGD